VGTLLVGEHNVVRPRGFDFGNAPSEIVRSDAARLAGRVAVHSSRNGTNVLRGQPTGATVFVGCLLNATAVARAAYASPAATASASASSARGVVAVDDATPPARSSSGSGRAGVGDGPRRPTGACRRPPGAGPGDRSC
jgi:2-phosphosulfolactate phosphatase